MEQISVNNEWSRLEAVILGIAPELYFPAMHPIELEPVNPWWQRASVAMLHTIAKGRRAPAWITQKYVAELETLRKVLLEHGVTVHRPVPITPLAEEPLGLGQMFARDPIMAVGNTLIVGQLQIDMRRKERRGLGSLLSALSDNSTRVASVSSDDIFLEGGDIIVDLPYVYVGVGKYASNAKGVEWLQSQLGTTAKVIPVPLAVSGILHLDCCMTLIGHRLGIIHRESLVNPLPPPLDTYEFIEVDARTRHELGTNVLVLDAKTIIVQSRHVQLQQSLRERGFRVIPLDFGWHARLGGAFRCATAPIRRSKDAG
ncbi:MAG: arginine deiminase [Gammaproteobacteria bacterium]|nr:arginine deiminase [Gammaproteobacteria bacterium]